MTYLVWKYQQTTSPALAMIAYSDQFPDSCARLNKAAATIQFSKNCKNHFYDALPARLAGIGVTTRYRDCKLKPLVQLRAVTVILNSGDH
jgi:hypothetical protein